MQTKITVPIDTETLERIRKVTEHHPIRAAMIARLALEAGLPAIIRMYPTTGPTLKEKILAEDRADVKTFKQRKARMQAVAPQ